jgi:hypothetical protein
VREIDVSDLERILKCYGNPAELKWLSGEALEILKVTSKIKSSLSR